MLDWIVDFQVVFVCDDGFVSKNVTHVVESRHMGDDDWCVDNMLFA